MISRIIIQKLFGRFNYDILFKDDTLTILTGPNGYGKSTILKIIEAFNKFNIDYFNTIAFDKIIIYFKDKEKSFEITKYDNDLKINGSIFERNSKYGIVSEGIPFYALKDYSNYITRKDVFEISFQKKYNISDSHFFSQKSIVDDHSYWLNIANNFEKSKAKTKINLCNTIKQINERIEEVYFIKEQRLIREEIEETKHEFVNVIEELPNKFKLLISKLSENYSQKANQLDSTYPSRLFRTEKGITEEEYREKMFEMNRKFKKIKEYNISDMEIFSNVIFKEEHSKALKIYFDDFDEKYKVYEEYILMFDLYTRIINDRLAFKKIKITKEQGLSVHDIDNEKDCLKLSELSSGEKQEIVLFFELIFDTPNNILLLIDEPEISLHIAWQKKFIDDLLKITEYKNFNIVVATHSPQIISNHWDRQIDLGELYGE